MHPTSTSTIDPAPVGQVTSDDDDAEERSRERRAATLLGRTPANPGGGGHWAAMDLLSTLAVVLFLFGVTGYANATPLGVVEDSLDAFFEEVWDSADEATIASGGTMIDLVRAAREDERAAAAARGRTSDGRSDALPRADQLDARPSATRPAGPAARPASQATSASAVGVPTLTSVSRATLAPLGVRATPTDTGRAAPTPTPRLIISTGLAGPDRRTTSSGNTAPPTVAPAVGTPAPTPAQALPAVGTASATAASRTPAPALIPTLALPTAEPPTTEPTVGTTPTTPPATPVATTAPPTTAPATPTTAPATPTSAPTTAPTTAPTETVVPTQTPTTMPTVSPSPTPIATATPVTGSVVIRTDAPATGLITMTNMRPAACATQNVTVFNAGRLAFDSYTLTTNAVGAQSILWTDPTAGLHLRVRRGSDLLYDGPIAIANLDLGARLEPGATDTLELSVCLPAGAGNTAQGQAQTISITWAAGGG